LAISASYELLEWAAAALTGTKAEAFLGTQGDVWDTQKDMALALIGAVTALVTLRPAHDRSLQRLLDEGPRVKPLRAVSPCGIPDDNKRVAK
jgi:putative membrane protein